MSALFGWQGFSLQHPDDWAPVALSGDRRSGYARLASPRSLSLQIRWAPAGRESLERAVDHYLDRLSRDARRGKHPFSREIEPGENAMRYRYKGEIDGEGLLFPTDDGRVAFLEAIGESVTARRKVIERARASFGTGAERWSVLGLVFTLPAPLRVEKKEFVSGRTSLALLGKGVRVTAERWGLAESLLAKMPLDEWAQGRLGRGWTSEIVDCGLWKGVRKSTIHNPQWAFSRSFDEALVQHQPHLNQIVLLRVQTRKPEWRPQWDWLT